MKYLAFLLLASSLVGCSAGCYVNEMGAGVYVSRDNVACWMVKEGSEGIND